MTHPGLRRRESSVATVLDGATRAIQASLLGLAVALAVRGRPGLALNTGLMLGIALLPELLRRRTDHRLNPVLSLLVVLSPFLHAIGALGLYRSLPVFDQVAHGVSAALVAGVGYVTVRVVDDEYETVEIPGSLRVLFVLIFTTSFGVIWEVLEFSTALLAEVVGGEPLLAQYGVADVVLDILFDVIGAVVVAAWGTRYFEGLRAVATRRLDGAREE